MRCPTCNGSGKFPDLNTVCVVCKGRAQLPNDRVNNPVCRVCNSSGKHPDLNTVCSVCGGWGRLPDESESECEQGSALAVFVKAGTPRTSHVRLSELFRELSGELRICDPWYGQGTLARLDSMTHCDSVKFLTRTPDSKDKIIIERLVTEFVSEHPNVEFRKSTSRELHDRFILAKDEIVLLGHGLKDIGAKDSFLVWLDRNAASDVIDAVRASFDEKWSKASAI